MDITENRFPPPSTNEMCFTGFSELTRSEFRQLVEDGFTLFSLVGWELPLHYVEYIIRIIDGKTVLLAIKGSPEPEYRLYIIGFEELMRRVENPPPEVVQEEQDEELEALFYTLHTFSDPGLRLYSETETFAWFRWNGECSSGEKID